MKGKALFTAAALIISVLLGGCNVREVSPGKDGFSQPLFSDSANESLLADSSVDVTCSRCEKGTENNNTDSDGETSSQISDNSSVSARSSAQVTSQQITVYVYQNDNDQTEYSEETDSVHSENEAEKTDSSTENSTDSDIGTVTESDTSAESDTETSSAESDTENSAVDSDVTSVQVQFEESDLEFVYNDARIGLGGKISDFEEVLGTPLHITDIIGVDTEIVGKTYSYEDFSIDTLIDGESEDEVISAVQIFSDNIVTEKGVKIGEHIEDVIAKYGSDWMRCEDEYRYYIGDKYMYFYVQNDIVANIGYRIDKDMEN